MIAAAFALVPGEVEAGGDRMWGTRGGDTMVEREHQIALTFERGYATMVVRRTIHNRFDRPDEAVIELLLPDRGVAVGLRTLAERRGKPHWYVGELFEAKLAAARYVELTGMQPHQPEARPSKLEDPALLAWGWMGGLALQVFPVASAGDKTFEYTIDMPAHWADGRWVISLDETGLDQAPAQLMVQPSHAGDQLYVDDLAIDAGHRLLLDTPHTLALVACEHSPVELELASVDTGQGRALVHWRVSVTPELSQLPERARVVLALDLSRSMHDDELEAQRHAALAYVEHFRASGLEAQVAVFGFDHVIRPLTDGFVSADEASGALRGATLEQHNGSAVDLALAEAARLLALGPARAPKRVVVMTDFLTASSRSLGDFEQLATSTDAVVHLAELSADEPALIRDDSHAWASVAARTEGVVWRASTSIDDDPAARRIAVAVFEEWARPIRIDALAIDAGELDLADAGLPSSLDEGQGIEDQRPSGVSVERLTLTGLLWNRRIEHEVRRSRSLSKRWAALVFGSFVFEQLDDEEMLQLARRGGAVSPVTSYLALEPGAQPSTEGFVRDELGPGLIGKGGGGGSGRSARGEVHGAGFGGRLDRQAWLDEALRSAWLRCGGAGQRGTLALEATYDEIVDFALTGTAELALSSCMREQTWALTLPSTDFIEDRSNWTVELAPP
jgi:hypothetical protein